MTALSLVASSKATLCRTQSVPDPSNPGKQVLQTFPCDLNGNALGPDDPKILIYRDLFTCKTFARVVEKIPSDSSQHHKDRAAAIRALNPIHYVSKDGDVNGWFVEAPDFNQREAASQQAAAPSAA